MTTACHIYVKIGTMKLSRLFEIVYLLLDRKKMTTRELAEYFEVSTRTILRDIEALSIAGVPVITNKGRNGGIYIMDSFRLDKTTLSKEEQELIIFALQNITASGNIETKGTLSRLSALFNEPSPSWIDVDFSRWGQSKYDNNLFGTLRHAILKRQQIAFRYVSSTGEVSNRKVTPLRLIFKGRAWYVICVKKPNQQKIFRLSRMLEVSIAGDSDIDDIVVMPLEEIACSDSLIDLVLRFSPVVAYRVYDEFSQSEIQQDVRGYLTVTTKLPYDNWLIGFLLSFETEVEIVKPRKLKDDLLIEVRKMIDHYS